MAWLVLYFGIAFNCDCPILEALWIVGPIVSTTQVWERLALLCTPTHPDLELHLPLKSILVHSRCELFEKNHYMSATFCNEEKIEIGWSDCQSYISERKGSIGIRIECDPPEYRFICWEVALLKSYVKRTWKPMSMAHEMLKYSKYFNRYLVVQEQTNETLSQFLRRQLQ